MLLLLLVSPVPTLTQLFGFQIPKYSEVCHESLKNEQTIITRKLVTWLF